MTTVLGLLLFSALLAPGDSLQCEICRGLGLTCNGSMRKCGVNDDTCVVTVSESEVAGRASQRILKGCSPALVCNLGPYYINLGKMYTARGISVCCEGADCASVSPRLPPVDKKANGKTCPACYSVSSLCPKEVAKCTGTEDHCVNATVKKGGFGMTVKGCITKTYCDVLKQNVENTFKAPKFVDGKCEPANKASSSSRFPFLALSWLLLKILLS